MKSTDMKLDGNAIGGLLAEIFSREMTTARGTCATCGAAEEFGALVVYARAPGVVVRCPGCGAVLLRIVRADGRIWLEARGLSCVQMRL